MSENKVVSLEDYKLVKEAGENIKAIKDMVDDVVFSGLPEEEINQFLDAVLAELEPLVKDLESKDGAEPDQS